LVKNRPTVALFGGSFDPPHKGHQAIVKHLSALKDIDNIIVMPAFLNPFKKETLADASTRLAWCRKIFDDPRVIVSDHEISQGRPVYTIETMEALQKHYVVKYLVIGADNLATIEKWRGFATLNEKVTWLVFTREGVNPACHKLKKCQLLPLEIPVSSTKIRSGTQLEEVDERILHEVKDIMLYKDNHDYKRES